MMEKKGCKEGSRTKRVRQHKSGEDERKESGCIIDCIEDSYGASRGFVAPSLPALTAFGGDLSYRHVFILSVRRTAIFPPPLNGRRNTVAVKNISPMQ